MKILVFDTETTGLPTNNYNNTRGKWYKYWGHIVQISWILYDTEKNKILNMEDYIIKLDKEIDLPQSSIDIHSITRKKMETHGTELIPVISYFIEMLKLCDIIIGHNVEFDISMVRAELLRCGAVDIFLMINKKIVCTMKKYKKYCNILARSKRTGRIFCKYPKLMELHEKLFGYIPFNLHDSLVDVIVCLRSYIKMEEEYDIYVNCKELREYLI